MITFVTFGTPDFAAPLNILIADATQCGYFDRVIAYNSEDLKKTTEYLNLPPAIKNAKRGWGYWWWKPFIIRQEMERAEVNDLIFYSDAGRHHGGSRIDGYVRFIIERYRQTGFVGVEAPHYGPNQMWTKPECFDAMACNSGAFKDCYQIQATFSMWKKTPANMKILAEWEHFCRLPAAVADPESPPKIPGHCFRDHRHDQSIITLLTRKHQLPYINITTDFDAKLLGMLYRKFGLVPSFKTIGFVGRAIKRRGIWWSFGELWLKRKFRKLSMRMTPTPNPGPN